MAQWLRTFAAPAGDQSLSHSRPNWVAQASREPAFVYIYTHTHHKHTQTIYFNHFEYCLCFEFLYVWMFGLHICLCTIFVSDA